MAFGHFGGGGIGRIAGLGSPKPIQERPVQPVRLNLNPEKLAGEPSLGSAPKVGGIAKPKLGMGGLKARLGKIAGLKKI